MSVAQPSFSGLDRHNVQVCRSHTHTKSVELLWARDLTLPDLYLTHTTLIRDRHSMLPAGFERTNLASEWPLGTAPVCLGI